MTTALTGRESAAAKDAYAAIANFFGTYGLPAARHDLFKLAKAAAGMRSTRMKPANVIWYFEKLHDLQKAAYSIHQGSFQQQAAILNLPEDGVPDLRQFAAYCGWQRGYTPWHFLPRFLGPKEFANPYRVSGNWQPMPQKKNGTAFFVYGETMPFLRRASQKERKGRICWIVFSCSTNFWRPPIR